jgi:uncharacterized membrane protein
VEHEPNHAATKLLPPLRRRDIKNAMLTKAMEKAKMKAFLKKNPFLAFVLLVLVLKILSIFYGEQNDGNRFCNT